MESNDKQMAQELRLPARDAARKETGFQKCYGNFYDECGLAWILSGVLSVVCLRRVCSDMWEMYSPSLPLHTLSLEILWPIIDYRRHFRPFFLDPDLETPTKYKQYYDMACYVVIQTTYNYLAMAFLILTVSDSLKLWSRLYVPRLPSLCPSDP